jgi:hypothetical protein
MCIGRLEAPMVLAVHRAGVTFRDLGHRIVPCSQPANHPCAGPGCSRRFKPSTKSTE